MSSSQRVFAGGRSNFSQTCSLLSLYLKEKGSFGELSLGLTPTADPKGTMDLLPKIEKSGQIPLVEDVDLQMNLLPKLADAGEENISCSTEAGQMTIFYGGQVLVFNDLPADKAKEVLMTARKCSTTNNHDYTAFLPPSPVESATGTPNVFHNFSLAERGRCRPRTTLVSDLPIARKKSLARFLEKRKDRITENSPYEASKPAAASGAPKPARGEAPLLSCPRSINQYLKSS